MATGRKALNDSLKSGVGVEIDYTKLHTEIGRLKRQLDGVKKARRARGMSNHRLNFVLGALMYCSHATRCQINMLEGY